jgi:uncharacterized protein (TIGR04255 family)
MINKLTKGMFMDKEFIKINHAISSKSPLVEVMVEMQWGIPQFDLSNESLGMKTDEELFKKFSDQLKIEGEYHSERMIPDDFPITPFQEVYRYRKILPDKGVIVYKLGTGIFSVNVSSPNQSWKKDFCPIIEKALSLLLESRSFLEKNEPFHQVGLRYLNVFDNKFTHGLSLYDLFDALGFKIKLPQSLADKIDSSLSIKPELCVSVPLKSKREVIFELSECSKSAEKAMRMDLMVIDRQKSPPKIELIMLALTNAYQVLKDIFDDVENTIFSLAKA